MAWLKTCGCGPRGIARDRRQQVGRALRIVRGGVDTVEVYKFDNGVTASPTVRELYNRIVVELRGKIKRPDGVQSWRKVPDAPATYEVIATKAVLEALFEAWGDDVIRADFVTHRAHGPGLQNPKPYHRR